MIWNWIDSKLGVFFLPQVFFVSHLLAYSGPTLSPTTSNSSGTK